MSVGENVDIRNSFILNHYNYDTYEPVTRTDFEMPAIMDNVYPILGYVLAKSLRTTLDAK